MTTCTWNFRWHAGRVLVATAIVATSSGLAVPRASADQISDLKAQAAAIASRISALGLQEERLSEQYDQARAEVQTLDAKVAQASQQLSQAQSQTNSARQALKVDALQAYVNGGASPMASTSNVVQNADNSLLRAEYVNTLATDQTDAVDQYHLATLQVDAAENNLKSETNAAKSEVQQVADAQRQTVATAAQLTAVEAQDKGQIATLIAQQQAAEAAAAQRAAQERLAAAAASAAAQAQLQQQQQQQQQPNAPSAVATVSNFTPPPVGSGASGAVAAAESRVGDWYQWGAAGPSTFDCSGLVMWAYAQVGISLPHFSGAQYADTTHIPMSDLEPGDLVFPADPGEHVAMYVGNGMIIEAPFTGATVHIVPMYSWFVLASRVG